MPKRRRYKGGNGSWAASQTLFRCSVVVDNEAAFQGGLSRSRGSLIRVAMHPMLAGYVFKVFFIDECRPDNIPLTSEGRFAFINTDHSRRRRVARS